MESVSSRLSGKLNTSDELLDHVIPILADLDLLPDDPVLVNRYSKGAGVVQEVNGDASGPEKRQEAFLNRQLGLVQKVVLEKVWIEWEKVLHDEGIDLIVLERLFVPPTSSPEPRAREVYSKVAISSYGVMTSLLSSSQRKTPLHPRTLDLISSLLDKLAHSYNLSPLFQATFTARILKEGRERAKAGTRWEVIVKDLASIPTRVANAWGAQASSSGTLLSAIPSGLTTGTWYANLSKSFEELLWQLSALEQAQIDENLSFALTHLTNFMAPVTNSPSFFPSVLPSLVPHLLPPPSPASSDSLLRRAKYAQLWRRTVDNLADRDAAKFVTGLLTTIQDDLVSKDLREADYKSRRAANFLLEELVGPLTASIEDEESSVAWETALPALLSHSKTWSESIARVAVDWVTSALNESAKVEVLGKVMEVWSRKESIKDGGDVRRTYLTILLLHSVYSLPPLHPSVVKLSQSADFLSSISTHLGLVQPTVRLLGMLVAEVVSARSNRIGDGAPRLSFGDIWDGDEPEKVICRRVRSALENNAPLGSGISDGWREVLTGTWHETPGLRSRPTPPPPPPPLDRPIQLSAKMNGPITKRPMIAVLDGSESDEEFPTFNLPPAPSESFLETLNSDDPSLYATTLPTGKTSTTRQRGKLRAPVYIPELTAYLRGKDPDVADSKEDAEQEAERVEKGLAEGEALIRRKTGWGGELNENSVDLTFVLLGLQNQFELDNFDELKQAALAALVNAVPTKVAPAIIEQYFTSNYSIQQRHIMLTALALGARELAALPLPRLLPQASGPVPAEKPAPADLFPSKRLPPALHRRLIGVEESGAPAPLPRGALEQLAEDLTRSALSDAKDDAETNIPEAAREKLLSVSVRRFASAPTPTTRLSTATAPTFAAVAAECFIMPLINRFWLYLRDSGSSTSAQDRGPYAGGANSASLLEPLVLNRYFSTLTILLHASRHSAHFLAVLVPEALQLAMALRVPLEESDKAVLESEMELILTGLDATVALDGGSSLMRSVEGGANIVSEVKDWAESVFVQEEKRGGENGIGRAGRAAAGVLLRVEDILERWRGKVGW